MIRSLFSTCLLLGVIGSSCCGADLPAFTDPDEAGTDFQIQGEYVGKVGGELSIGIQVIALGNYEFEGVLNVGGLPSAGWDESTVYHLKGKTADSRTSFHGVHGERLKFLNANFSGSVEDGVFSGEAQMFQNHLDDVTFRLDKVLRKSPTLGSRPPFDSGAIILFDGTNVDEWQKGRLVEDRLLDVGTTSKRDFGSVRIHMEFCCPFMPTARGMQRGNSGIYVKHEWEVQIVDSFGWHDENRKFERLSKFGRCGGIHEMIGPRINMSYPPLSWQTYDIEFTSAKFDAANKRVAPAMMTVRHNGVVIHDKYVLPPVPPGRDASQSKEGQRGPIFLQDHGNPVRFRNIWVIQQDADRP
ncbi:MAG: hypothetical protein CMJ64_28230 [Planctomycetaceae bacterium]|nr:hypothetical protein [Planctomycetaceae bacterium]